MSNSSTTVAALVELQRASIAMERAAIARWLRRRLAESGPSIRAEILAAWIDGIERASHHYDGDLFTERHHDADSNDRATAPDGTRRA